MEEKVSKINFFKKLWYSITKFENYPTMAMEGTKRAVKYLILLTAIVSVFVMISGVIELKTLVGDVAQYVQNNIPEFSYSNGKLAMETQESIIVEDTQNTGIDRIVINTLAETEEQKNQTEQENSLNGTTILFLNDKIILKTKSEENQELRQTYTYSEFIANYTGENIEKFNKTEFVEYITSEKMSTFYSQYALTMFVYLLFVNILLALLDALEIAILGLVTTTVARIRMRFSALYNMAIYSLTLPMILNVIYIIINYFTDFTIKYFQVAYITIAYIYLAAAIFILKDDVLKKMQEVEKIKQEQQKVKEEIEKEGSKEDGQATE